MRTRCLVLLSALLLAGPAPHARCEVAEPFDVVVGIDSNGGGAPGATVLLAFGGAKQAPESFPYVKYLVPDSRAATTAPYGRETYTEKNRSYRGNDRNGVHFVQLDSTVPLHAWGHLGTAQLEWLDGDLKKQKAGTPIVVLIAHAPTLESPAERPLDNPFDLAHALAGHNVVAIFTEPGPRLPYRFNGIAVFPVTGTLKTGQGWRMHLSTTAASIQPLEAGGAIRTLPLARSARVSRLRAAWDDPDVAFLERRRPAATLEPRAQVDSPDNERATYQVDEGPRQPMKRDARDIWRDQFVTKPLAVGVHTVDIQLTTSNNVMLSDELIFDIERNNSEPTRRWATNLDDAVQASPILVGDILWIGSADGLMNGLDVRRGRRKLSIATKGQIVGDAVATGDRLYFGSTDHSLYAIDARSGKLAWKHDCGVPVVASPAVAAGTVCIGLTDRVAGLDARTGAEKWSQPSAGYFTSAAAADDHSFYLQDNAGRLVALDAASGAVRWTVTRAEGGPPPSLSGPAVAAGRVYALRRNGLLSAYNAADGSGLWSVGAPSGGDPVGGSRAVVVGETLCIAGDGPNGDVYGFEAATGRLLWRNRTGQRIEGAAPGPSPDGAAAAILGLRGRITVLDMRTGRRLWGYELGPGNIFSTPILGRDAVYTATMANDIQSIAAPGATPPEVPVNRERRKPVDPAAR